MDPKKIENVFNSKNKRARLNKTIEDLLNKQIEGELTSSQIYLGLAAWCDFVGYEGAAKYFYDHVGEERGHMMKIYEYMLDKNVMPKTPQCSSYTIVCTDLKDAIEKALEQEIKVTERYESALILASKECQMTYEFLQWFIHEQKEEEANLLKWLDRLEIIGGDKRGMFFLDQEILESMEG